MNNSQERINKNNCFGKLEKILNEYPHPLEGSTFFQKIGDNYISLNFFPKALERGFVNKDDLSNFHKKILKDITKIKRILYNVELEKKEDFYKKRNRLKIKDTIYGLIFLKHASIIEAQKGGLDVSEQEIEKAHKNVNYISDYLYGPSIDKVDFEKEKIEGYIEKLDYSNLSIEEKKEIFDLFKLCFPSFSLKENQENDTKSNDFLNKKINSNQLKEIFELAGNIIGIDFKVVLREDKKFIDIGENGNYIPEGGEYTIERVLALIDHEINTHLKKNSNHQKTGLGLRSPGYIKLDEGLAVFNERFLKTDNINHINDNPTKRFIYLLMGEILDYEKLYRFIYLFEKNEGIQISDDKIEKIMIRLKRYHPFDKKGVNRKDVIYYRNFLNVIDYLLKNGNYKNLYIGKNSFDDLEDKDFVNNFNKNGELPLFIGKIIYQKFLGEKIYFDSPKYENIGDKDFRFKNIGDITFKTKREIVKLIQLFD